MRLHVTCGAGMVIVKKQVTKRIYQQAQGRKGELDGGTPEVGVFFLVGTELFVEGTSLAEAGTYANCKMHEGDHIQYWDKLLLAGAVPESEYDEHPRGRVVFNFKTEQFTIYADRCILGRKALVAAIKSALRLPNAAKTAPDSHYRCPKCLGTTANSLRSR
jgi:hypothetical protein